MISSLYINQFCTEMIYYKYMSMIKVSFFINTDNIKQCQETYMLFEHVDVTACQRHHDSCIIYSTVSSIVCNLYNALMYLKKMRITQKMRF